MSEQTYPETLPISKRAIEVSGDCSCVNWLAEIIFLLTEIWRIRYIIKCDGITVAEIKKKNALNGQD